MAAQQTGRRAALIELEPKYVDVTIRRFETEFNETAIHAESGETFTYRNNQDVEKITTGDESHE